MRHYSRLRRGRDGDRMITRCKEGNSDIHLMRGRQLTRSRFEVACGVLKINRSESKVKGVRKETSLALCTAER